MPEMRHDDATRRRHAASDCRANGASHLSLHEMQSNEDLHAAAERSSDPGGSAARGAGTANLASKRPLIPRDV